MVNRKLLMNGLIRAGFTLSRALFRKKCGGPSTGTADSIFLEKMATFLVITYHRLCVSYQFSSKTGDLFCSSLSFSLGGRPFLSGLHKIAAPFVGAPARPNMLSMPKSAAGLHKLLLLRYYCTFLRINLLLVSLFDNTV